ncbi:non-ribosomal peptide synthetase [Pseudomonas nunensis]|uniref:non-ribosomal peptide synthetase n=1 Tax=Pseudomonas nunensis TaxID=2961896 RepID=UPI0006B5F783|nr:amino acid adenylation domain-containing protein [Pseudomonas nunensis]KOY00295.1 thioester reductase [Pseudomonas nunensis]
MNEVSMDQQDLGFALTPEQQRLLEQLPKAPACADALRFLEVEINGVLDPQRLQSALDSVLAQQPMLVARLDKAPGFHGLRQFVGGAERFPLTVQARVETPAGIQAQLAEWAERSFVVGESEGAQAVLYRLADDQWKLVLGLARHSLDESGVRLLYQQLVQAYAQDAATDDEETGEFTQYLDWRSEVVLDEDAAGARVYWQDHLQGADPDLSTPWLAYRNPGSAASSATESLTFESALRSGLQQVAVTLEQSPSVVLQAAWWWLLGRLSGHEQVLVGVRHDSREDYEYFSDAVGVFEKTLPLNLSLTANTTFSAWVTELAARLDEHRTWQEYWSPELAPTAARPAYGFAVCRATQVATSGGLQWAGRSAVREALFELMLELEVDEAGSAHALHLRYDASRYSAQAIEGLLAQLRVLLENIVANAHAELGQLSVLGATEQQRLLSINPPVQALADARLLPQRIADFARTTPDAIALTDSDQRLSYGQLQVKVEALAQALKAQGLAPGAIVALALPRSAELVVAMLAAWRIGAAYLPLDPQWPQARQALMLEQAGAALLLVDAAHIAQWHDQPLPLATVDRVLQSAPTATSAITFDTQADQTAYVLFTSGSTGVPKGVVIEHQQLLNYTAHASQALGLEQCRQFGFTSTVAADLGNTALFGALFNGATLHVASDEQMQDGNLFAGFLQRQAIDCLKIVPSHLAALLDSERAQLPRTLVLGGEPIAPALVQRIAGLRSDCRVFNHYGPTEATVGVLVHPLRLDRPDAGVLSQVLGNNQVFVLDDNLQLAPVGVLGELYLGGAQLCRGYVNVEADSDVFIQSPFNPQQRLYRTGDLARYRPDLAIALHGRRDQQIKVRGFRIELAEIEAELLRLPQVAQALVLPGQSAQDGMLAFIVPHEAPSATMLDTVRDELALRLPSVMLPQHVQLIESFPRLANGKVDRKALQQLASTSADDAGLQPRDALEQLLVTRMSQLLGVERLGIDRDFFAAGGHSLLVIKLVAGIRKLLQCEIQPGVVFDHPTVAGLAAALRARESSPGQLEKIAQARLRLDNMSPEEKAALTEKARQLQNAKAAQNG